MGGNRAIAFLLLAFSITASSFLRADAQGRIEGTVMDRQHNELLIGANVFLKGTIYGAVTDLKGKFVISGIPAGNYTLLVKYIGYQSKEAGVSIQAGQTVTQNFKLEFQAVKGEEIVVTAQAGGQMRAISEQLASNTIANVVSQSRIRELPDVNAAESVGRLPGISISRWGGEATQVQIRGLSAKYNTVTINGVAVPATGGDDRSVDLSGIPSIILDGIEVKKAVTADMDADVLGGTVDLRLREAEDNFHVSASAQGGYNRLQDYYGNYNFGANISNRFLDSRLGVIVGLNADNYNRSADKFSGGYRQAKKAGTDITEMICNNLQLREDNVTRGRSGASILFDYRIPYGKVIANAFYNQSRSDGVYRINRMDLDHNSHYYDIEDRSGATSIFTGDLGIKQDFDWIKYDADFSRTGSRTDSPEDRTWNFAQENNGFIGTVTAGTLPNTIPPMATNDTLHTGLANMYNYDTRRDENQTSAQLNVQVPFRIGSLAKGFLKFGGKARWLDRTNDENQSGRNGLQYGNNNGPNQILKVLDENFTSWNLDTLVRKYGVLPITAFRSGYSRSNFMEGEYPLGYVADVGMLNQATDYLKTTGEWLPYAVGSRGRDYDGKEEYQAAYIMTELNFGKFLTLLPGVRWEKDHSQYHGQRYREVTINNKQSEPTDLLLLENIRENEFWLPQLHLKVQPREWMKIRLARTETLTRPDYMQYAPITSINSYQSYIRAANSMLKPAHSENYDASVSVFGNRFGLFTGSWFYKTIDDLILQSTIFYQAGITLPEGLNIPSTWLLNASPQIDTYTNNPTAATYKGFELDWQTNFWYLPSVLHGIVLNVNYSRIFSSTEKQLFFVVRGPQIPNTRPPRFTKILVDSSRWARMPDQPAHIANVTLGYDYKGFSARLSYLYQTDKLTFISLEPIMDNFSGAYKRWDLTLQQKVGARYQVFVNFNNLNNRKDENFRGYTLTNPAYIEYYGFTMDFGVRYKF